MHKWLKFFLFGAFFLLNLSGKAQYFIANNGQWNKEVLYKIELQNAQVYLKNDGLRFHVHEGSLDLHNENGQHKMPTKYRNNHVFDVRFNNTETKLIPQKKLVEYHNYFIGKDESNWQGKVPLFEEVMYTNLYTDTDLLLKSGTHNLKYDIILAPHANPENIRWTYESVESLSLENDRLIIETSVGKLVEEAPIAWQIINGKTKNVKISFAISGNDVGFKVGRYNKEYPLIIDPNFVFSTYTGSTSDNFGFTATYDKFGNTYGGGIVFGTGYPITTGAFDSNFAAGAPSTYDVAISKFSADGTQLIFSTYLGGTNLDQPHSMVVDSLGNLIVIGSTGSSDFPVTTSAFDTTFNGGPPSFVGWAMFSQGADMFITKFNSTGTSLLGSTYLGGDNTDGANTAINHNYGDAARGEVVVNNLDEIYFASSSKSTNFPTTIAGAFQDSLAGNQDAIIGKLNSDLSQLLWSTYLGGLLDDAGNSLKLNTSQSEIYIAGGTKSVDFPVSTSGYQSTFGGNTDGWIARFDATNGSYLSATYNGTSNYDQNFFVALDHDDEVYIFGQTKGVYPTTPGLWTVPNSAQFIHKFTPDLQQSLISTVFGDGSIFTIDISPTALMVDDCKSIYLSGWGGNTNNEGFTNGLPVTHDAEDSVTDGSDFYLMVLDGSWQFLEYASFFGGSNPEHVDGGTSRFSPEGIIYQSVCAGCGGNSDFPSFPSTVWSTTNNSGNCNLACFKVNFGLQNANVDVTLDPDTACAPHLLTFIDNSSNVDIMLWDFGDGTSFTGRKPQKIYSNAGNYTITIIGIDTLCLTSDTVQLNLQLNASSVTAKFTANYDSCATPHVVQFTNQSGFITNQIWSFGDGTTSTANNPTKVYAKYGTYQVWLAVQDSICGNWDTAYSQITFIEGGGVLDFKIEYDACVNWQNAKLTPTGTGNFQLFQWDFGDGDTSNQRFTTHLYAEPGNYNIVMTAIDTVCGSQITQTHQIFIQEYSAALELFPNVFSPNGDGINDMWHIMPDISPSQFSKLHVEVYNRWGSLVYSANDPNFIWDGVFEDQILAEGVYFWLVWYDDLCGGSQENHGEVHIVR